MKCILANKIVDLFPFYHVNVQRLRFDQLKNLDHRVWLNPIEMIRQ